MGVCWVGVGPDARKLGGEPYRGVWGLMHESGAAGRKGAFSGSDTRKWGGEPYKGVRGPDARKWGGAVWARFGA